MKGAIAWLVETPTMAFVESANWIYSTVNPAHGAMRKHSLKLGAEVELRLAHVIDRMGRIRGAARKSKQHGGGTEA